MSADILNEVLEYPEENLSEELLDRVSYLTVRFYYEAGRDEKVKSFIETAKLLPFLKSIALFKKIVALGYLIQQKYHNDIRNMLP